MPSSLSHEEYPVASDEHLHLVQTLFRDLFNNKNILVPLSSSPSLILDIGTGSGAWAIDVSKEYPSTQVIGTDIPASTQITSNVPQNCHFRMESVLDGLKFAHNSVDLVHSRWLVLGLAGHHWPAYLKEISRVVKPDGFLQMIEYDKESVGKCYSSNDSLPVDSALSKYQLLFSDITTKLNYGLDIPSLKTDLQNLGFVDIKVEKLCIPVGGWSEDERMKSVGETCLKIMKMGIESLDGVVRQGVPEMSFEERKVWYSEVGEDMGNPRYRIEIRPWLITARKPE